MKYFLSLLAILALAGAGCAQVSTTGETEARGEAEVASESIPVNIEVDEDGNAVVVQEGGTTVDEDGVPITEIILGGGSDAEVDMETTNFAFSPEVITAAPGDRVRVTFSKNVGFHTFTIDEAGVDFAVAQGESVVFTAPDEPGEYPFYCDIGSHRAQGMEGMLIIK